MQNQLHLLYAADPDLAQKAADLLMHKQGVISEDEMNLMVNDTLAAMALETDFGYSTASGYCVLLGEVRPDQLQKYHNILIDAAQKGPTLGRLLAIHSPPVIAADSNDLWDAYIKSIHIMLSKGAYTLNQPLQTLTELLRLTDTASALSFLNLLCTIYSQDITYNESLHLTYSVPPAVLSFPMRKRTWQIDQFCRVIDSDIHLADAFITGMQHHVRFLTKEGLDQFVTIGLSLIDGVSPKCANFFSLTSSYGRDVCARLQTSVHFSDAQQKFSRYLQARVGKKLSIRLIPQKGCVSEPDVMVYSDGDCIYIPEEISLFETTELNMTVYQTLIKLESAYYEFDTYQFDLEKYLNGSNFINGIENQSDFEQFFLRFPKKDLAVDIFTIFEQGRIRRMMSRLYPGMAAAVMQLLHHEANKQIGNAPLCLLNILYNRIALNLTDASVENLSDDLKERIRIIDNTFSNLTNENTPVETSARLTERFYSEIDNMLLTSPLINIEGPLKTPFGIKPRPNLVYTTWRHCEELAKKLKQKMALHQIQCYQSDIRKLLLEQGGQLTQENLKRMVIRFSKNSKEEDLAESLTWEEISKIFDHIHVTEALDDGIDGKVFWYREWDCRLSDYLHRHVRVRERLIQGSEGGFYEETLQKYRGLVRRIRYAFELLKPEGLTLLRRWIEGDEFDYRALLTYALDKKAGAAPSERLYLKRVKHHRDVSVLLLADMSKSTANPVSGSDISVLQVEKEAIVLFCEALQVVGDAFAVAGFSGTGRLGVDYYIIKDFDEPVNEIIRGRIQSINPQRSTRMGAAVRHASRQLDAIMSKIKILIIISDGFPNDADYKQSYAIEDTRKAIAEARADNIFVKAISVNLSENAHLDDIYGSNQYHIISDVRDLPDRLLKIYSLLTR